MSSHKLSANVDDIEARNESASGLMKQGLALLAIPTTDNLHQAIQYFDKAVRLRSSLPLDSKPWFRYGLAAAWMNRADALTRLGLSQSYSEALNSYDRALEQLALLPLEENPLYRRRFAVAWLNQGLVFQLQSCHDESLVSFDKSIALLSHPEAGKIEDRNQLLACVWMNRANALLRSKESFSMRALEAARRSLSYAGPLASHDLVAAEAALKARLLICQAIATHINSSLEATELIDEASDAVEEGLDLIRHWESRGVSRFGEIAGQLFCFGTRLYQTHQPHFLGEFVLERLHQVQPRTTTLASEIHSTVTDALWRAASTLHKKRADGTSVHEDVEIKERFGQLAEAEAHLNNSLL